MLPIKIKRLKPPIRIEIFPIRIEHYQSELKYCDALKYFILYFVTNTN